MPPFTVPLQHQSDPIGAAEVAEVPPPSSLSVGDPRPEPRSHTTGASDPNPDTNYANDGPLPAHPNSPPPPVMGPVEQGNQTPVGPSVVAQPGPFTQGLPGLDAVGPGTPNNLNSPLGGAPHPPHVAGPFQGNTGPVNARMSTAEGLKVLASRYLYDPRSRVAEICMTQRPSGGVKVLIVLDVDGTL
ncbi:hypothetical protein BC827DRAFT_1155042 [Russula dissimulans]|nr:hypothetical protein BC827DRAFT_1155042 [Russula dissimulans]